VLALLTTSWDLFAQRTNSDHRGRRDRFSALSIKKMRPESIGRIAISATLPPASVGKAFNAVLSVSGGSSPYQFALGGGTLAPGLSLNGQTGTISGVPLLAGSYDFKVVVTDRPRREIGDKRLTLTVDQPSSGSSSVIVTTSPLSATVSSGASYQFTATVRETSNVGVTWSATKGTISTNGIFVAPQAMASTTVAVTATSTADPSKQSSATVTVLPLGTQPVIATNAVPSAIVGQSYVTILQASGGTSPYAWSLASGALPQGLQLDSATGTISGTPVQSGYSSFAANVTDSDSQSDTRTLTLSVSSQVQQAGFDGPAELPRLFIQSSLAATPAPGQTIVVNAGGNFQAALNSASCGDTISLQAGATFTGIFTLPAKSCDDNHWIIIRTSAPDSSLPAEGTRLTPCYAGVASLPARRTYNCPSVQNVMAKIILPNAGTGPIVFASGANHYRFIGLEITRPTNTPVVYSLISLAKGAVADHLLFDRMWIHGTAQDETARAIQLGSSTYVAIVDSYLNDVHCVAISGSCVDSQAIAGGTGSNPMGPYKIVNNFLEAAGENIMFGGGPATLSPADIEIRLNHMFKPLAWMSGQPGFVGGTTGNPFIVKNLFELKNAQRVLFEGNVLEYSWGGFSQSGFAILLTPKNQGSNGTNVCPSCRVTDVTIRYSTISHVAAGAQIANALSAFGGGAAAGERYSIHDIVVDDINPTMFKGPGNLAQISIGDAPSPMLQDIKIDHITAFPPHVLLNVGAPTGIKITNFVFTNSIVTDGTVPFTSTGGTTNCAYQVKSVAILGACISPFTFTANAILANPATYLPAGWPAGNYFPAGASATQFINFNGGDYHLVPTSPYKGIGTDGKDLGADIDTILQYTANVR
jgi:hypothetical protein